MSHELNFTPAEFKNDSEIYVYPPSKDCIDTLLDAALQMDRQTSIEYEIIRTDQHTAIFNYGMPIGCTDGISGFLFYCKKQSKTMKFFNLLKSTNQFFTFEQFHLNNSVK